MSDVVSATSYSAVTVTVTDPEVRIGGRVAGFNFYGIDDLLGS